MNYTLMLNLWSRSSIVKQWLAIFLSTYLIWVIVALLVVLAYFKQRVMLAQALIVIIFGYGINWMIGKLYFVARPFVVNHDIANLINKSSESKSFPSDHALLAFMAATYIYYLSPRWGWLAFILAGLVSMGRIMVGVHYPIDVITSAILGILLVIISMKFKI